MLGVQKMSKRRLKVQVCRIFLHNLAKTSTIKFAGSRNFLIWLGIQIVGAKIAFLFRILGRENVSVNPIAKTVLGSTAVALWLTVAPVQAVPVTPNVSNTTAVAIISGQVPDPDSNNNNGVLPVIATPIIGINAGASITDNVSSVAATYDGAAEVSIDPTDFFGGSAYRAKSEVLTHSAASTSGLPHMNNQSLVAFGATLDTNGLLGPGETATVDAVFNLSGSLIYVDPTGQAAGTDGVPDMQTSVSVLFLLADVVEPPLAFDPDNVPVAARFNGSATLGWMLDEERPILSTQGDLNASDFTMIGLCNKFICQYDIDISVPFVDIQSVDFGETFEAGLFLLTSVDGVSAYNDNDDIDKGRRLVSNFFDTASFSVTLQVESAGSVPEPGTALILALGIAVLGASRRRTRDVFTQ